jgi:hypothetical protein
MIVPPDMVFPMSRLTAMITMLVLMTGVILLMDVNTMNAIVTITTPVLMTLVIHELDAIILLFQLMMKMNAHMIIAARLMEFTTLKNQFLIMMPV